MDNIERAIRNALAKVDVHNVSSRQRIYESAWSAHERALVGNAALDDAQKEQRRQKLKDAISKVEQEMRAVGSDFVEPALDAPQKDDVFLEDALADDIATLDTGALRSQQAQWDLEDKKRAGADLGYQSGVSRKEMRKRNSEKKKNRSPLFRYGVPVLLLLAALVIGYSLYSSFTDLSRRPSNSVAAGGADMAPLKEGQEPGDETWITIYQPSEATRITAQGRATAEILRDGARSFARITSPDADTTITFDVGEGILDQLAGRKATFDIIAKAEDGELTQMSISCNFAGLGDCGRRRYDVNQTMSDFLFDVDFASGTKAGGAGTIAITSDVAGTGKPVDIYEIRVSPNAQ
ncbi:hypothetical protein AAIB41_15215 [Brucella sp. BE17]|uniref:hypothetical protein n=1 Tax=Brucella sp. BE17 TaxID=3142977 RepID=UPI0031BB18A6